MGVSKNSMIGNAGEYYVCTELCRRNILALITPKNETGSGHANYLKVLKTTVKTPLFRPYINLFRGKKSIINNNQWRERKDIISQGRYGTPQCQPVPASSLRSIGFSPYRTDVPTARH